MERAANICVLILLLFNTITDMKFRKVLVMPCALAAMAGTVVILLRNGLSWTVCLRLFSGAMPGMLMLGASLLWEEQIGAGDGLTMLPAGIWMGAAQAVSLLFTGLVLAALFCLVLLAFRRAGRKTKIPFMPFLLAGQVLLMAA